MVCGERHKKVDEQGRGLCSVPMWCNGLPAGFCDEDAYGNRDPKRKYIYDGYVMYLACPGHGGPTVRVFRDGDMFCAVRPDFVNLQESPAGFGETEKEAIQALSLEK
jgi:hypothetical protein